MKEIILHFKLHKSQRVPAHMKVIERLKKEKIALPVVNNKIDFKYMEKIIKEKMEDTVNKNLELI